LEQIRSEMNSTKSVESNRTQAIEGNKASGSAADQAAQPTSNDDAVQARLRELRGE